MSFFLTQFDVQIKSTVILLPRKTSHVIAIEYVILQFCMNIARDGQLLRRYKIINAESFFSAYGRVSACIYIWVHIKCIFRVHNVSQWPNLRQRLNLNLMEISVE